jgi:hypothetical protein
MLNKIFKHRNIKTHIKTQIKALLFSSQRCFVTSTPKLIKDSDVLSQDEIDLILGNSDESRSLKKQ